MKIVTSQVGYEGTEHFVVSVTDEVVMVDFVQQVDDIMISSPDGDVLVSWDNREWNDSQCLLIKKEDNLKEIANCKCTHFLMKAKKPGDVITVYITGQRN